MPKLNATIGLCLVVFAIAVWPIASNSLPYLDDAYLIEMQRHDGFWAPTASFQAMWGYYRYFYTSLMSPFYAVFAENLDIARVIGLSLHAGNAVLLAVIGRNLRWSAEAVLLSFCLFLFFPFSLEAVAWPANLTQYPLAPFVALLGAAFVSARSSSYAATISGACLMGSALWIHEQIGPVVLLLLGMVILGIHRSRAPVAAIVLGLIAANLTLIYLTRASNVRLSGEGAASLSNIWKHAGYLKELIRTTPFGGFFYDTRGFIDRAMILPASLILAVVAGVAVWRRSDKAKASTPMLQDMILAGGAIGAYVVSLIPILMASVPWHTARVVYIPFLAYCIAVAYVVQIMMRSRQSALIPKTGLILCLLWTPMAISAEADAFNVQVNANWRTARSLVAAIGPIEPGAPTVLIITGYLPWDNSRPIFGEHFIGATPSEFSAAFKLPAHRTASTLPMIISSPLSGRVCSRNGVVQLSDPSDEERRALASARDVFFAIWSGSDWILQRNGALSGGRAANVLLCKETRV